MRKKLKSDRPNERSDRRALTFGWMPLFMLSLVCFLAVAVPALAGKKKEKPPRTVMGVVVDELEKPIVGAVVEMTDVQTGKKLAIYTHDGGHYQFAGIDQDHDYKIRATYHGVTSQIRTASSFDTRNTIRLNLQIPPPKEDQGETN
ncbi:MAG: carboxypeptidase-like regulatory domain-containing protein [Deltaproteobacteria bacterium]